MSTEYFYQAVCCAFTNVSRPDVWAVTIVWRYEDKAENYRNYSVLYRVP